MIYSDGYIHIKWLCLRDVLSEKRSLASRQTFNAKSGISDERENDFNRQRDAGMDGWMDRTRMRGN